MEPKQWARRLEKTLLEYKVAKLGLTIEGSGLEPLIARLYEELRKKGLCYEPPCFLADEWNCPVEFLPLGFRFI